MASGRRSAGERVLEGRHVIGLFFLMLLFSGVFFTLGYVMGRNQYSGQVRAESAHDIDSPVLPRPDASAKRGSTSEGGQPAADAAPSSDWEFYHAGDKKAADNRLKPAPVERTVAANARTEAPAKPSNTSARTSVNTSRMPRNSYSLQVAALSRESDAMALATNLQKKRFPAYVLSPHADKFYRVQVGPYSDQKSADAARKGLESAGFKAIVKH